jgi:hypothetical protein
MSIYAVDKLMAEARRLAAEYRRVTGKTLPLSGEIAINDAVRLLGLEASTASDTGYDALRGAGDACERFLIKARVVFDEQKGAHRLGELKLDKPWDTLLLVLMDASYETIEIYAVARQQVAAALATGNPNANKKATLSVPRIKIIGAQVWSRAGLAAETAVRAADVR